MCDIVYDFNQVVVEVTLFSLHQFKELIISRIKDFYMWYMCGVTYSFIPSDLLLVCSSIFKHSSYKFQIVK